MAPAGQSNEPNGPSVPVLELVTQPARNGVQVVARGEIDLSNAQQVRAALVAAEASNASWIVLDLSAVTFIDSTGLRMLLEAQARSRADSNRLRIVPSPFLDSLLEISGLRDRLKIQTDPLQ